MLKMNNKGQMSVLEVILVAGMILIALYIIRSQEFTSSEMVEPESRFETIAESVLVNLASKEDTTDQYASVLSRYISDKTPSGANSLKSYIYETFPLGTMLKVIRVNYSKMFSQGGVTYDDCVDVLIEPPIWMEDDTRVSRLVVADGYVYEIVLCIWYNMG